MVKDWIKGIVARPVVWVKVTKNTYAVLGMLRLSVGVGLNGGKGYCWEVITNCWLEILVFLFRYLRQGFCIVMKTIVFFFICHVPYGFVVDGECMMGLQ